MPIGTARTDLSFESAIYTGMNDSPPQKTNVPALSHLFSPFKPPVNLETVAYHVAIPAFLRWAINVFGALFKCMPFFPSAVSELLRLAAPGPKFGCECNKNRLNFPLLQSGGVGERTPRNKEHGCFPLHLTRGPGKMSILPAIRLLCIHGSGRIPNFNLVFCPDRFFFFSFVLSFWKSASG